jgi:hypothetical protein
MSIKANMILFLLSIFNIKPSGLFSSESMWYYRYSVGLLGRAVCTFSTPQPTWKNTNTEETWMDIHASSGIQTDDFVVCADEDISSLSH